MPQLNGLSPVWVYSCSLKSSFCTNFVSQQGQLNGFSLVWILSCSLKSAFCTNFVSQWGQLNGFSLVWILSCSLKLAFSTNFVSQWGQLNGFPPMWIPSCSLKSSICTNIVSQCWQLNGFLEYEFFHAISNVNCNVTNFMSQLNGLSPVWAFMLSLVVLLYRFRVTTKTAERLSRVWILPCSLKCYFFY